MQNLDNDFGYQLSGLLGNIVGGILGIFLGLFILRKIRKKGLPPHIRACVILGGVGVVAVTSSHWLNKFGNGGRVVDSTKYLIQNTGMTDSSVTKPEVDAALREVSAKAAELTKRQQSTDKNDPQAMQALKADIDAYNTRNHEVKAMVDRYRMQVDEFKGKFTGVTWNSRNKHLHGMLADCAVMFGSDGKLVLYVVVSKNGISAGVTIDGNWELNESTLMMHWRDPFNPQTVMTEAVTIDSVDEAEMHLRNMKSELIILTKK